MFPWNYNGGAYNNMPPFMNPAYQKNYFNGTDEFKEMIKRNIEAENSENYKKENEALCRKIGGFAENERNSFLFYEYLREICSDKKHRELLRKISGDCEDSKNICLSVYKSISGEDFFMKEGNINERIGFFQGILWAVEEESRSVFEISEVVNKIPAKEKLLLVLYKKSGRIGLLNYILFRMLKK